MLQVHVWKLHKKFSEQLNPLPRACSLDLHVHSQIRYVPGNTPFNVLIHTARNSDKEGREHEAKRTSIFVFLLFSM